MKVKLTTLLDLLRGGAWPPSVRAVRRSVKSDNEQDPYYQLQVLLSRGTHSGETAADEAEEGMGNGRSVCPESLGLHAYYNVRNNGLQPRKGKPILKSALSSDRGL
jgi:hypothetical protein